MRSVLISVDLFHLLFAYLSIRVYDSYSLDDSHKSPAMHTILLLSLVHCNDLHWYEGRIEMVEVVAAFLMYTLIPQFNGDKGEISVGRPTEIKSY